jgi:hypothetical protein
MYRYTRMYIYIYIYIHLNMSLSLILSISLYIYAAISNGKWKEEAQVIFLNPFTVCS